MPCSRSRRASGWVPRLGLMRASPCENIHGVVHLSTACVPTLFRSFLCLLPTIERLPRRGGKACYDRRKPARKARKSPLYTQLSQQVWRAPLLDARALPCLYSLSRLPPIGGLFNVHLGATHYEADVPAAQSAPQARPRVPRAHAHEERPQRARTSAQEGASPPQRLGGRASTRADAPLRDPEAASRFPSFTPQRPTCRNVGLFAFLRSRLRRGGGRR